MAQGSAARSLLWLVVACGALVFDGLAAPPDEQRVREYLQSLPDKHSPIPELPVSKATYFNWLRFSGHLRQSRGSGDQARFGPRHLLPTLAHFVHTGDSRYAKSCLKMLYEYDLWIRDEVRKAGWHEAFCQEPGYIGIYQHTLSRAGQLSPQDKRMLEELLLFMARNIHAWATPETFWRGPMHRAQGEGVLKGLAAAWYPDAAESREWESYASNVYRDWWQFRDLAPNDINYFFAALQPLTLRAILLQDDRFFTDPEMQPMWERLLFEISPDGSIPPYGAHWGWNQSVGNRIAVLELLASKTRDGRYRFGAHRLMNYLIYQRLHYYRNHMLLGPDSTEPISLAYLFADDSIPPVQPNAGSRLLERKETIRVPSSTQKESARELLGPAASLDPLPDRAHIDCCLLLTNTTKPSKFAFRSGWERGDFFVLVDLFPRHDPLNPLGILGITRWGAGLACTTSAKGRSQENRVVIETLRKPDKRAVLVPETTVEALNDSPLATYAAARVTNYDETEATVTRRFLFVKNRFLLVRDEVKLPSDGQYKLTSVFNTRNVSPLRGLTAALTWFDELKSLDATLLNPPVNLLVWFLPARGFVMDVVDRSRDEPTTSTVPLQLRYSTTVYARANTDVVRFSMLLRPQTPVDPFPFVRTAAGDEPPDESQMKVLVDDSESLAVQMVSEFGREIGVINPKGKLLTLPGITTRAAAGYFRFDGDALEDKWSPELSTDRVPANP